MDPAVRQRVYEFLDAKGLRRTGQRDAIIEAAFSTEEHFSAETLLVRAKDLECSVSRATVYRTLPLLVASGLLREMDFGKDHKFYDPNFIDRPHHNHLICLDCNKIVEFEDRNMEILETLHHASARILAGFENGAHRGELRRTQTTRRLPPPSRGKRPPLKAA